jgi:hypothetical protein
VEEPVQDDPYTGAASYIHKMRCLMQPAPHRPGSPREADAAAETASLRAKVSGVSEATDRVEIDA